MGCGRFFHCPGICRSLASTLRRCAVVVSTDNMGLTGPAAMDLKLTVMFQQAYWGWSETYGFQPTSWFEAETKAIKLTGLRKQLLAGASVDVPEPAITAFRIYSADPSDRRTQLFPIGGKAGVTTLTNPVSDMAWNAVELKLLGPTMVNKSNRLLRGIPDSFIEYSAASRQASFKPTGAWWDAKTDFCDELKNGGWGWFRIVKVPLAPAGVTYVITFYDISDATTGRVSHRKTGRPFDSPRGRKWARVINKRG